MQYRNLGRSGLKVSEICLGTMTFGHSTDEREAAAIMDAAFDAGVNFFDSSNTYAKGRSEEILGDLLKGRRHEAVIGTKVFNPTGPAPNDSGLSRLNILRAVEESLRRLQTDYIDVYYLHHTDDETPLDETLRALDDLVRDGKVRYIACSNFEAWRLLESMWISDTKGLERFTAYQPQYNLVVRDIEAEILPVCRLKGVGVVAWGPLAGGFLTGKYKPGERTAPGTRSEENWVFMDHMFAPNADDTLKTLLRLSKEVGCAPGALALRWVLEQPDVSSAIVGARTVEQFRKSLEAVDLSVSSHVLRDLTKVSAPPLRYPHISESTMTQRRRNALRPPWAAE
ncbi:aldo/keto reductase [Dichotomicrobium thermohalophilum]|uniref:Aryl-alcohol dehydrogenase-like predicted oxidoreductase n=1 Tax=Dichotomicrobium thermohalophilum TaxID=933063 RepID=A0A397Q6P1_9HYPH|nr:aldo/keto reductase [Dichotomicrobium thermohalophilum]RIA56139.1 aryl-alcohol dehydrogenase-like predicted oxidoreductase [Dichotomicrobium thermohalophilum]